MRLQKLTPGACRREVWKAMQEVRAGTGDLEAARVVVKMSTAITESMYAESKVRTLLRAEGAELPDLGDLDLEGAAGAA